MAKILVIDDSRDVLMLTSSILRNEHEVYVSNDWAKAFPHIFRNTMDLILLDVNMPGFRGDQIAKMLKQKIKNKLPKIVLFSAIDKLELENKVEKNNLTGYIQKTYNKRFLLAQIQRFLKNAN